MSYINQTFGSAFALQSSNLYACIIPHLAEMLIRNLGGFLSCHLAWTLVISVRQMARVKMSHKTTRRIEKENKKQSLSIFT